MKTKSRRTKPVAKIRKRPAAKQGAAADPDHQSRMSSKRLLSALSMPGAESVMADGLSKLADSFGFKKLESVFDHRVAAALERIGYPSPAELRRLVEGADSAPPRRAARKARTRS